MANEIKDKFSASSALTITLAGLASSDVGLGRQSTMVDNSSDRYSRIQLYVKVLTTGGAATGKAIMVYLLKGDKHATPHRTGGAGASDTGLTRVNALMIGLATTDAAGAKAYYCEPVIDNPGPEWGILVVHNTGAALDATGTNHWARYVGINPEVQ